MIQRKDIALLNTYENIMTIMSCSATTAMLGISITPADAQTGSSLQPVPCVGEYTTLKRAVHTLTKHNKKCVETAWEIIRLCLKAVLWQEMRLN